MGIVFGLLLWPILTLCVGYVIFYYDFEKMGNADDEI